ncbi:two component transcriptional regulator, LuxR family [Mariniphaga anaerophila]|uniref:Two component transcriptional regulator, LuxR family n=1 Tax=Mariniphaga anaerophila TaxID=1484053 RepID=A0A1M5A3I2_9BACT|nr:response regulator transcription factor [Mariniphaga anaerophila]SHF24765.1 two component transcriptional regulator, LuxR family [Mariniphaga anaerophila]
MEDKSVVIVVTDDHKLFRKGIRSLLEEFRFVKKIYEAGNGLELLELLKLLDNPPHVILLDIQMPLMDGIEAHNRIRKLYPSQKVIILTMEDEEQFIMHMISEGVNGYLLKNAEPEELEEAIEKVMINDFYFPPEMSKLVIQSASKKKSAKPSLPEFSERELEVLGLICREYTAAQIADKLEISQRTVEGHWKKLLEKSKAKNVAGLVVFAMKNNLVFIK